MKKRREDLALPAGTTLRCGGIRYTLGAVICQGGSCLLYQAKREGSALPFGIKECCPGELVNHLTRIHGVLTGSDPTTDRALAQSRARMAREALVSQRVAAVSPRSIPVLDGGRYGHGGIPCPGGQLPAAAADVGDRAVPA